MTAAELDARFPAHPLPAPTDEQKRHATYIREKFRTLAIEIEAWMPEGRLKAMAFTALEEASTWAVKAVFQ